MGLAYLGLGSNQGSRRKHMARAVRALGGLPGCKLVAVSPLYESEYQGPGRQDPYLNACLALETELLPRDLLRLGQELEKAAGRQGKGRMLPRTLDIDLLLMDCWRLQEEDLQLPHPRLCQRRFVLQPLLDLDSTLVLPGEGKPLSALLATDQVRTQTLRKEASEDWWQEAGA